jgi:HSP20 family molecular chaperone IbpA
MSKTTLWIIIGILAAISLCQSRPIYAQNRSTQSVTQDPWQEQDQWMAEVRKHLFQQDPVPLKQFDDLFNDRYFGYRFDPFAQIEQFQKRMRSMLGPDEQSLFSRSYGNWFNNRMNVANISPEVKTTEKEVILSFKIPGLDGESMNININKDRIRIAYEAKTITDKRDEKGGSYFKRESSQHFEKIMPIPEGADAKDNRIVHEGDTVKIIFKRIRDQANKA